MPPSALARLRRMCLGLPETYEKKAWGEPTWRVSGKDGKLFAMYASAGTHHTHGCNAVWIRCTPTNQGFILRDQPSRYFKPPYVGTVGWVGAFLDGRANWAELAILVEDAYQMSAPRKRRTAGEKTRAAQDTEGDVGAEAPEAPSTRKTRKTRRTRTQDGKMKSQKPSRPKGQHSRRRQKSGAHQ